MKTGAGEMMKMKQISLTMPEQLFLFSKKQSEDLGYRNVQEYLLELVRDRIFLKNLPEYEKIVARMKKGIGVKKMTQSEAIEYFKNM
jgi:hypothetical protein